MSDSQPFADPAATTAKGKIAPRKVVRKSKAERDRIAAEEAQRSAERAAAAEKAAKASETSVRSAAPGKRSAQERSSWAGRDETAQMPAGVFGKGARNRPQRSATTDTGHSELLEGQEVQPTVEGTHLSKDELGNKSGNTKKSTSGAKRKQTNTTRVNNDNHDSNGESSADELMALEEPARDIQEIYEIADEEEEDDDAIVLANHQAKRTDSKLKSNKVRGGLRPVRAPRAIEDLVSDDALNAEVSRKAFEAGDIEAVDDMDVDEDGLAGQRKAFSPELPRKMAKRASARSKDAKLHIETAEERAERMKTFADIRKLRHIFSAAGSHAKPFTQTQEDDGSNRIAEQLILVQLPPLIPLLHSPTAGRNGLGPDIKTDPETAEVSGAIENADTEGVKARQSQPTAKYEGLLTADEEPGMHLPAGQVGKLKLHRSGKVTLDWGGTDMEVRHGVDVNFLQDAVLVETPSAVDQDGTNPAPSTTGQTFALGAIQKKLVIIPDWQKLYD